MLFGCAMKQRRLGLATLTPIIGMVGTIVDGIHPGTISSQLTPHFVMNLSQRLLGEIASGYTRLVGDYHYLEAIFIQKPYRLGDSGQYLEILWPAAVVDISGNGSIPVKENCFHRASLCGLNLAPSPAAEIIAFIF
jgi:hypothetical protein